MKFDSFFFGEWIKNVVCNKAAISFQPQCANTYASFITEEAILSFQFCGIPVCAIN